MRLFHEISIFQTVKSSKVIISLFETVRLSVLISQRNLYNSFKSLKDKRAIMALGRSPEYHWNQIISKSVHRFSRRSRLKLFSIKSPGGHFVQQSRTV